MKKISVSGIVVLLSLPNPLKLGVENEAVVGAASTCHAPNTSE